MGLSLRELSLVSEVLLSEDCSDWYVWQHAMNDWRPLVSLRGELEFDNGTMPLPPPNFQFKKSDQSQLLNLVVRDIKDEQSPEKELDSKAELQDQDVNVTEGVALPPIPIQKNNQISPQENLKDQNSSEESELSLSEFMPREFKRHRKEFQISIEIGEKKFTSTTKDISVGGMLLNDPLPEWVVGYFSIKVTHPLLKQTIEHTCSVVENQDPDQRIRLMFAEFKKKETQRDLEKWILAS